MKTEKAGSIVFALAIVFLAFIAGAMVIVANVYPASYLHDAYSAAVALFKQKTEYNNVFHTDLWKPARTTKKGVIVNHPALTSDGYTLFTSSDGAYARLISMQGKVLHEWRLPYSQFWNKQAAVKNPRPDKFIYMRKARVLPNGDLIAIYIASGDTPWGYGMVKMDRNSKVIWTYLAHTHHDFDIGPDGRIAALTHKFTSADINGLKYLDKPFLEDFLVILSPDGQVEKKISLLRLLVNSRFRGAVFFAIPTLAERNHDPLHPNAVEFITADKAAKLPFAKAGDLLISFREIGLLAVIDPRGPKVVWATRGPWLGQHDPTLLNNGNILLFDNRGNYRDHNHSRVIEFNPQTMKIVWAYTGSRAHPLNSVIRSSAQRLANGNTLITESDGGRLLEVTPGGRIAWEYVNPVRAGNSQQYIPVLSWGRRIAPDTLDKDFRQQLGQAK